MKLSGFIEVFFSKTLIIIITVFNNFVNFNLSNLYIQLENAYKFHFSTHFMSLRIPFRYTYHVTASIILVHISLQYIPFQYTYHFSTHTITVLKHFQ